MDLNVRKELAALDQMTVDELRRKYAQVYGEATSARHKVYLIKRIAWRLQSQAEGGLSERARRRAVELANDADLRSTPPRSRASGAAERTATAAVSIATEPAMPMPGTILTRQYKGKLIQVTVLPNGFEYDGQVYRSLSAVAKAVTGNHWNGLLFFGLRKGA